MEDAVEQHSKGATPSPPETLNKKQPLMASSAVPSIASAQTHSQTHTRSQERESESERRRTYPPASRKDKDGVECSPNPS